MEEGQDAVGVALPLNSVHDMRLNQKKEVKMRNENDTFVIVMLMVTIVVMSISLSAMHNSLAIKDKQLEQMIEQQDRRIADMEQEYTYRIDMMADDIFALDERLDETELRLDDHMATMVKIKNEIDELRKPTPTPKAAVRHKVNVRLSESDIQLIAKLVYEEAGAQSYKCQKAIASVVINRMVRYKRTARQVVYEPGVFSVDISGTRASAESIRAVRDVIKNGTTLPKNVLAFRNQHYHRNFGRPYCCIDGVYFSTM